MNRRGFLSSLALNLSPAAAAKRPNVLFLVADEWRGQALPSAGDTNLVAPHLARFAREGTDFRRAYTSYPVCCPSRAAMLTGKYPHAAGVQRNHSLLPLSENTFSQELQRSGYRTGYIGKWHLDGRTYPGFVPQERRRGFDYWAAYNVVHSHYGAVYFRDTPDEIRVEGFEADHQTDLAIDFVRQKSTAPFFLYVSWVAPHPPLTPPPRHANYDPDKIQLRPNVPASDAVAIRKNLAAYYGLCSAVDENLGRLLGELDRQGIAEDTIVVFTSDHGTTFGSHGIDQIDQPFEEATRVPLILRYPRKIKPRMEADVLFSNVDLAPTLLSLCDVRLPRGMQGLDQSALLLRGRGPRRSTVYAQGALGSSAEWRMVVRGYDKLVVDHNLQPTQLYDLREDPYELENLIKSPAARRKRHDLLRLVRNLMERTSDRVLYARPEG